MVQIKFNHPVTNKAIEIWGEQGQLSILQEEAAENVTAVARFNRGRVSKNKIAEEIADFYVSSMSVVELLGIEDMVKHFMDKKITRLNDRIHTIEMRAKEKGISILKMVQMMEEKKQ